MVIAVLPKWQYGNKAVLPKRLFGWGFEFIGAHQVFSRLNVLARREKKPSCRFGKTGEEATNSSVLPKR